MTSRKAKRLAHNRPHRRLKTKAGIRRGGAKYTEVRVTRHRPVKTAAVLDLWTGEVTVYSA